MCFQSVASFCFALLRFASSLSQHGFYRCSFEHASLCATKPKPVQPEPRNLSRLDSARAKLHHSDSLENPGEVAVCSVQGAVCRVLGYRPKVPVTQRVHWFKHEKPEQFGCCSASYTTWHSGSLCSTPRRVRRLHSLSSAEREQTRKTPRVPVSNVRFARLDSLRLAQSH